MESRSSVLSPSPITLLSGEQITIRLLEPADAPKLITYFDNLSEQTKHYFSPHPFDSASVQHICDTLNPNQLVRLVATSIDNQKIIAYVLLLPGASPSDTARYQELGIRLQPETDYSFAPSIADTYQSRGLGGHLLQKAIAIAQATAKNRVILWGGVQASNERAVRYYQKYGFVKMTEFERNGLNYSMCLNLE